MPGTAFYWRFPFYHRPAQPRPSFPRCSGFPAGPHPQLFRCDCLPAGLRLPSPQQMQRCRGREGDPGRPKGGRSAAAGADITRPQAGKVRADAPRDTRRTGYSPIKKTAFALPQKGEYGGAGGVEGNFPLSPHAPRRAGDPPPVSGSSRNSGKNKTNGRAKKPPSHPCPAPGRRPVARAGQQPQFWGEPQIATE